MMKKKLTIMMVALLSLAGLVFAEAFEPTEATTEVLLTKANITDQEYLSVTTDNWQTGKTYGGVTGDFYNMSKEERQLSINVKGVSKFEVFVQNSNAGRSYTVTVGSGAAQTITHNGGGVESSGEIETGTTDEVTITLASDGSGSVYPVKVILTKGEATQPVVEFEDFEITNEQMSGEFDDSTLPACATFSGSKRGDSHGYGNVTLTVFVDRPVKFTIGGCQYANPATCKIIDAAGNVLAEPNLKTDNCYHQDKSAATFEYTGEPTTLTFTNIAYLPYFKAEAFEAEQVVEFEDFEITNEQMSGEFDDSTLPACATFSGSKRGDSHGYGNVTLTVFVDRPVKFTIGGCQYANPATCKIIDAAGNVLAEPNLKTDNCYHQDKSAATFEYTGEPTTLAFTNIAYLPYFKAEAFEAEQVVEFEDFEITNEQMSGEFDDSTLPACATFSGSKRGDSHGYGNVTLTVFVDRPVKFTIGGCQYANPATCKIIDAAGNVLAEPNLKTENCYHQDKSAATFEYTGEPTTLTFTNIAYLPYFKAEAMEDAPVAQDVTATWDFANNCAKLVSKNEGGSFAGSTMASSIEGIDMTIIYHGGVIMNNDNSYYVGNGVEMQIPVKNKGDIVSVVGYPGYNSYTVGGKEHDGDDMEYTATATDAENGYVSVKSTGRNNYIKSITVTQFAPKEVVTLTDEAATVTFPFHEGTEGQTATFTNDEYWLSSKVTHGSKLTILDKSSKSGIDMTRFQPTEKIGNATEDNAIRFLIQPKFGLTFTPTKVTVKSTRFGTNDGKLDFAWQNPDGTTISLATEQKPNRENGDQGDLYSTFSYEIKNPTPDEGACGLVINLYGLANNKQIGFADIVIEGVLNGTEKEVPMLASFKANGVDYNADDVFEANGDIYEATIELSKSESMISASNPISDATPISGTVGDISYDGDDTGCVATIPVTLDDITINYVVNFVQKPDFTLTYLNTDGSEMGTQTVEKDAPIGLFAINYTEATAGEGQKVRGWFHKASGGQKFTEEDIITADTKLYAVATDIEVSSEYLKYTFDLTDPYFYAEDHEAFNPAGDGFYWHDTQHGWAFKNGNTIDLLVGSKATITISLCQYGSGTGILVKDSEGNVLETLDGKSTSDGDVVAYNYEGEPGTLTLEMQCGGEIYIHNVKIVNTATTNYVSDGQWYFVKAGDAKSLLDVIDVVNGINAAADAPRSFIFIPDGTYDLGTTCLTTLSGNNVSLIGQSMEGVIIKNKPETEGIGKTAVLVNTGKNTYIQDLTLKNEWDYHGIAGDGRAVCLQDKGNNTICKNVTLLSYQDTYYSNNNSMKAYWEDCDIHGTVDFICGGGDIRFQNTTLSLEPRNSDGTGSRTVTAPTTNTEFGYVFDGCTIVDLAKGKGNWNMGRTWQNQPICIYLNTKLDADAAATLIATRWIEKGMNNTNPRLFGEYGTTDADGNNITPSSNVINSFDGAHETIIDATTAAQYAYDAMFGDWDPKTLAEQVEAPTDAVSQEGTISWSAADDAIAYALFKNGEFVAVITEGTEYELEATEDDELTIRAANSMGGFGESQVISVTTGISELNRQDATTQHTRYYNTQGVEVSSQYKGVVIKVQTLSNGKKIATKVLK